MSAKVTVQTPTERIIEKQKAKLKDHVIDEDGRVIKLRLPDALDEYDLSSALGADASNQACSAMAQTLLYVESIDNEPFSLPKSYAQVRASIKKIGSPGMRAIVEAISAYAKEHQELNEQGQIDAIKK